MEKVTGFLVVYSPLCCVLIETEDQEFLDHVMESLNSIVEQRASTKEGSLIENVWISFQTEEVPIRAYPQWYLRSFQSNQAQKEIKGNGSKVEDRIYNVYTSFIEIGNEIQKLTSQQKSTTAINQKIDQETLKNIPSSDELMSIAGPEIQTIREFMEFRGIPDILLEKELCFPVEPDL